MRAVTTDGGGGLTLARIPRPLLPPDGGLVQVRACGLCGSDLEKLGAEGAAGSRVAPPGVVLGHEVVGILERTGEPPVRVALAHHVPCGECRLCRAGHSSLCPRFLATALDPGGFAETLAVSGPHLRDAVFGLPGSVDDQTGTLLEPLSCVLRALDAAAGLAGAFPDPDVRGALGAGAYGRPPNAAPSGRLPRPGAPGEPPNVLVAGCGSVGLLFLSVLARDTTVGEGGAPAAVDAAADPSPLADRGAPAGASPLAEHGSAVPALFAGARLFFLEPDSERATLATMLGAAPCDTPSAGQGGGAGIDVAFVTAPAALPDVVAALAPGGIVVVFAAGAEWSAAPLDLDAVYRKEITLAGVRSGSPAHLRRALGLLVEGRLPLAWFEPLVVGLEDLPEAVRRYRQGGVLKVVVWP